MRTRRPNRDYIHTRRIIRPVDRNICAVCGNDAIDTPRGIHCLTCSSTQFVKVPPALVDTVRVGLWMAQIEQALFLSGQMHIGG